MGRARIARRELASLSREKTIVLALLIQLFIAAFSSFLLVGLVAMYDPGATDRPITLGVAGEARGTVSDALEPDARWDVVGFADENAARASFAAGRVDALLVTDRTADGVLSVEAVVPDESVLSTVIVVQVREALETLERARRAELSDRLSRSPVEVPDLPHSSPTVSFTYTVLLPMLVYLPVFISGSIGADSITEELDAGTFNLLRVTPLSATDIVDGKMLAMVGLAPLQAGTWLLLLRANGTPIDRPLSILVVVTGMATVLVALGTGLALGLGDRRSTQLVYSLGVLVVFATASLLPESPPNTVAKLAIGSATAGTLGFVAAYGVAGLVAYAAVRRHVRRSFDG